MRPLGRAGTRAEPPLRRRNLRAQPDPAPSRLAYRMERLWLRPMVRQAVRTGLPMLALVAGVFWYVSDEARVLAVTDRVSEVRRAIEERPEFMVRLMAVDGASPELAEAVRESVAVEFPISSFDLDLDALRAEIGALDAIATVRLRIRPGGILQVEITEREPALVWRAPEGLRLVDATGHPIAAAAARAEWPELPLIAGVGAAEAAEEALALHEAATPLHHRLRGLQRRGERRWDVVLTRGQRIMLPETDALAALERFIALDEVRDILEHDLVAVDLRLPARPTLRLSPRAAETFREGRTLRPAGVQEP